MDVWLRTSLDVIIIPFINLTSGIIGGLVGSLVGGIGKNDTFRWSISYALIGIICSSIYAKYAGTIELMFQPQLHIFVPLFAIIGLVWSGIFLVLGKSVV